MPLLLYLQSLLVQDSVSLFCTSYCPICVEGIAWFRRMFEDYTYLKALQERLVLFWGWQESSENVPGSCEPPEICCGGPALCGLGAGLSLCCW